MQRSHQTALALGTALLVAAVLLQVLIGAGDTTRFGSAWGALWAGPSSGHPMTTFVWEIRMPRAFAGALVGMILGAVGAAFQPTFRNALAEPYLLGVSGGAAAGGTAALAAGLGTTVMLAASWAGAVLAMVAVFALAREAGRFRVERMLLAGVLVGTVLASITTLIVLMSGGDTNRVLRWLLGSLSPMPWWQVAVLAAVALPGCAWLWRSAGTMNAMTVNESAARSLGVPVENWLRRLLAVSSLMVATTVSFAGLIGFVGLLAPHIARRWAGVDARNALPLSAAIGGVLLVTADLIAQRLVFAVELPVGAITALAGALVLGAVLRPPGAVNAGRRTQRTPPA